ncbi:MAG TPA: hypothetical protein VH164_04505, partial [Ktedonobacteraceae bacterium]|nr:hypothetical protein [Ktedonobacteraceae bacterium]
THVRGFSQTREPLFLFSGLGKIEVIILVQLENKIGVIPGFSVRARSRKTGPGKTDLVRECPRLWSLEARLKLRGPGSCWLVPFCFPCLIPCIMNWWKPSCASNATGPESGVKQRRHRFPGFDGHSKRLAAAIVGDRQTGPRVPIP